MKRAKIPYGTGHVFLIPVLSQADTKLFKASMTIAAGDAKLRNKSQAFTNLTAEYVAFTSGGTAIPQVGETLTGATSGTTAIVVGWFLTSGSWAAGTAAGGLFLESVSAALQAENLNGSVGGANMLTIGGDSTVALMADAGQGNVAVPLTSVEAQTDFGAVALIDAAGAEWCDDEIAFETYGHESSAEPGGCILTDTVNAAGQTTTNIRLSGAPTIAPKVGYYFEVTAGTGIRQAGFVKTYSAGATYDVVPYVALDTTLDGTSVVKFYVDAKRVPAHLAGSETLDLSATLDVNAKKIAATAQTAADIGSLVAIATEPRLAELDAANLPADVAAILTDTGTTLDGRIPAALGADGFMKASIFGAMGTALTETAGQIAAAFTKFFNKAAPTGTINSLPDAVAGAASGVAIVGSLMTPTAATIASAVWTLTDGIETGLTPKDAIRLAAAILAGTVTAADTAAPVFGSANVVGGVIQGTTARVTGATVDAEGNRAGATVDFS